MGPRLRRDSHRACGRAQVGVSVAERWIDRRGGDAQPRPVTAAGGARSQWTASPVSSAESPLRVPATVASITRSAGAAHHSM